MIAPGETGFRRTEFTVAESPAAKTLTFAAKKQFLGQFLSAACRLPKNIG
ncbi:hypothetical protein [Hoeflea sp. TYP-13]